MAKANVNIADVHSFETSVSHETESLNRLQGEFSSRLDSTNELIVAEKRIVERADTKCGEAFTKISVKINILKQRLEQLRAELAVTPPTITVTETDEEGNSYEVEVPNPDYYALLSQISLVESQISQLQAMRDMVAELQRTAQKNLIALDKAVNDIALIREDLNEHLRKLNGYSEEAVRKLQRIQVVLEEYRTTKIGAPDLSKIEAPDDFGGSATRAADATSINLEGISTGRDTSIFGDQPFGVSYKKIGRTKDLKAKFFSKTSESQSGTLTVAQKAYLSGYGKEDFEVINEYLRGKTNDVMEYRKQQIEGITNACESSKLPKSGTLYRGMDHPYVFDRGWAGMSIEELRKEYVGTIYKDDGFCSTSSKREVAEKEFANARYGTVVEISAPKGAEGVFMGNPSKDGASLATHPESEILLNRGSEFRIDRIDPRPEGGFYVKTTLVGRKYKR